MTSSSPADSRKTYGEGCLAAHALDLIGDRWALLVVRELMLGPKRFGGIRARLPGIATNMLTRRIADLETAGVLVRRVLPPPASVAVYELTPAGLALWPIIRELCRWALALPGHDPTLPISPTALMLSMRAMMIPAPGSLSAAFAIEDECFLVALDGARIEVARLDQPQAPIRFTGDANALAAVVYGPVPLSAQIRAGALSFAGDPAAGQAFIDRFALTAPPGLHGIVTQD